MALEFMDLILHMDQYINSVVHDYGIWVYLIIFLIVFLETGLVFTPFLPGDSLIFVLGALAVSGELSILTLFIVLSAAAILGDTVNYWIGYHIGPRIFRKDRRFLKKEHLKKTENFYEKYGAKTIIIARFVPIIRTFAPFVAGVGKMRYRRFLAYNVAGGIGWVVIFLAFGYYLGNIPVIKQNLSIVLVGIIVVSLLFAAFEFIRQHYKNSNTK